MRALVDEAAEVVQRYAYDAYGNMRLFTGVTVNAPIATSLLYSGEKTDATGLQYLRARYYDPRIGRFTTLDPFAGYVQGSRPLFCRLPLAKWSIIRSTTRSMRRRSTSTP